MKCCERRVPSASTAQDGEAWACPKCGSRWIHVCDEAEGCWWEPDAEAEVMAASASGVGRQGKEPESDLSRAELPTDAPPKEQKVNPA